MLVQNPTVYETGAAHLVHRKMRRNAILFSRSKVENYISSSEKRDHVNRD
jgi:hypothetical protein